MRCRRPRAGLCASPMPSLLRHCIVVPVAPVCVPPRDILSRASPCQSLFVRSFLGDFVALPVCLGYCWSQDYCIFC